MPDLGLEMERLLAPIVVHGEIYGYMWIIADVHALSQIDMMAIEIGATVAALLMLYQESLQTAEASLKGSLMAQLIEGNGGPETVLTDQSLRYGVDLRMPWRMLLISLRNGAPPNSTRTYRNINQVLSQRQSNAVAAHFAGQVVILASASQNIDALAAALRDRLAKNGGQLTIAISAEFAGADQVANAHHQCHEVLAIARRIYRDRPILAFDSLGYIHSLYHAGPGSLAQNPDVPVLRQLLAEKTSRSLQHAGDLP